MSLTSLFLLLMAISGSGSLYCLFRLVFVLGEISGSMKANRRDADA